MIDVRPTAGEDPWEAVQVDPDGMRSSVEQAHLARVASAAALPEAIAQQEQRSADNWFARFLLSDEDAAEIADAKFIVPGLIVDGLVHAIIAEPNGGKTTLMMHLAPQMVNAGYRVVYVNADISAPHAVAARRQAEEGGFHLALPDFQRSSSMETVRRELELLAAQEGDLSGNVVIIDTLKKMVDVIQKGQAKRCYNMLRQLSARGMTVICLGHTNKHKDGDGKPVYEGTGDLRADVDNLIYLHPRKEPDGSITVSTDPDKTRAALVPLTFHIAADRSVTQCGEYIDVAADTAARIQLDKDSLLIEAITAAIEAGHETQSAIVSAAADAGSKGQVRAVLKRYRDDLWREQRGFARNRCIYSLLSQENWKTGKLGR